MDDLLWLQVLATFGVDVAQALLCGVLLSNLWLSRADTAFLPLFNVSFVILRSSAILLAISGTLHLAVLTISFSGQRSVMALARSMPDVWSTHAGLFSTVLCGFALALLLTALIGSSHAQRTLCGVLLFCTLCLRADTGHAAVDARLSAIQLLQWAHLMGMATWSGAVMVSGLLIMPKWPGQVVQQGSENALASSSWMRRYLVNLSTASTWGLSAVLLSGVAKAYLATGGSLRLVRTTPWGYVLIVKVAVVGVTILLGGRNRWLLASSKRSGSYRVLVSTLRIEAVAMIAVLLLSAWLANTQPPLE